MKSFYPDVAAYTAQLRSLETYQRGNPTAPEANFVLAYHYLCLGYPQDAAKQLESVVKLRPDDTLAAQLLKALTQSRTDQPAPGRS
jgi:Tfp pilus assembly protein PilF